MEISGPCTEISLYYFPKKIHPEKVSYIFSKKPFFTFRENGTLIFQKMEFFSSKYKTFQEGTFRAQKILKKHSEKMWEMELSSLKL